jgi:hypothetical protein
MGLEVPLKRARRSHARLNALANSSRDPLQAVPFETHWLPVVLAAAAELNHSTTRARSVVLGV